jgi:predicted lactoylglutathione lyase
MKEIMKEKNKKCCCCGGKASMMIMESVTIILCKDHDIIDFYKKQIAEAELKRQKSLRA